MFIKENTKVFVNYAIEYLKGCIGIIGVVLASLER